MRNNYSSNTLLSPPQQRSIQIPKPSPIHDMNHNDNYTNQQQNHQIPRINYNAFDEMKLTFLHSPSNTPSYHEELPPTPTYQSRIIEPTQVILQQQLQTRIPTRPIQPIINYQMISPPHKQYQSNTSTQSNNSSPPMEYRINVSEQINSQQIQQYYNQMLEYYTQVQQEMKSQKTQNSLQFNELITRIHEIDHQLEHSIKQMSQQQQLDYQQILIEIKQYQKYQNDQQLIQFNNKLMNIENEESQLLQEIQSISKNKYKNTSHNRIHQEDNDYTPPTQNPVDISRQQYGVIPQQQYQNIHNKRNTQIQSYAKLRQDYGQICSREQSYSDIHSNKLEDQLNNKIEYQLQPAILQEQPLLLVDRRPISPIPKSPRIFDDQSQGQIQRDRVNSELPMQEQSPHQFIPIPQSNQIILNQQNMQDIAMKEEEFSRQLINLRDEDQYSQTFKPIQNKKQRIFDNNVLQPITHRAISNQAPRMVQQQLQNSMLNESYIVDSIQQKPQEIQQGNMQESSRIIEQSQDLGQHQFYNYLRQRYPLGNDIHNRPNHGDQRISKDQEAIELTEYIYCTVCDQFIAMKSANNHTQYCQQNNNKHRKSDTFLDLFICCTQPQQLQIETKEQKRKRLNNELNKISYLIKLALKQKDYTWEQNKLREYCHFGVEIINNITQSSDRNTIQQLSDDLIAIYQMLDQQQQNFYKQQTKELKIQ